MGQANMKLIEVTTRKMRLSPEDRFWGRVVVGDGCWAWTGTRHKFGYGVMWLNGRNEGAHRISWMIHRGPIPADKHVLHRCDNPPCTNPSHLFLGTPAENMYDKTAKGRHISGMTLHPERAARGERCGASRLGDHEIFAIRFFFNPRRRGHARRLAEEFGVSPAHIWNIVKGKQRKGVGIGLSE